MTVSELARKAQVGPQTVRYYEKRGLLPRPSRWGSAGYRDFDDEALASLHFIQGAKAARFTLSEIKRLIELRLPPRGSCEEGAVFFDSKLAQLARQAADIKRMTAAIRSMRAACRGRDRKDTCLALWRMERR